MAYTGDLVSLNLVQSLFSCSISFLCPDDSFRFWLEVGLKVAGTGPKSISCLKAGNVSRSCNSFFQRLGVLFSLECVAFKQGRYAVLGARQSNGGLLGFLLTPKKLPQGLTASATSRAAAAHDLPQR